MRANRYSRSIRTLLWPLTGAVLVACGSGPAQPDSALPSAAPSVLPPLAAAAETSDLAVRTESLAGDESAGGIPASRLLDEVSLGGGVAMRAPDSSRLPVVDAASAYTAFVENSPRFDNARRSPANVLLVTYTDETKGQILPDGGVLPDAVDRLSWAIVVANTSPTFRGGRPAPDARAPQLPVDLTCDFVYVVDAVSGDGLAAFETCPRIF